MTHHRVLPPGPLHLPMPGCVGRRWSAGSSRMHAASTSPRLSAHRDVSSLRSDRQSSSAHHRRWCALYRDRRRSGRIPLARRHRGPSIARRPSPVRRASPEVAPWRFAAQRRYHTGVSPCMAALLPSPASRCRFGVCQCAVDAAEATRLPNHDREVVIPTASPDGLGRSRMPRPTEVARPIRLRMAHAWVVIPSPKRCSHSHRLSSGPNSRSSPSEIRMETLAPFTHPSQTPYTLVRACTQPTPEGIMTRPFLPSRCMTVVNHRTSHRGKPQSAYREHRQDTCAP